MQENEPVRPMPLIAFHGTADPIVPFYGGPSRSFEISFPTVPDWMRNWAVLNGCEPAPVKIFNSVHVTGVQYDGSTGQAPVVFYTIEGGNVYLGVSTTDELLLTYYAAHPVPGRRARARSGQRLARRQ